jgi:hypothetical protein
MLGIAVLGMTFRAIHLAVFGTGFDAARHEPGAVALHVDGLDIAVLSFARRRHARCSRCRRR